MSSVARVPGHSLRHEGRPVLVGGCCGMDDGSNHLARNDYDQHGHGLCSCSERSGHETTTAARQQWHRAHKAAAQAAEAQS